jgi:eukaryotic-like serine/threonine-protein kinase
MRATGRSDMEPRRLSRRLRGDLDTITLKALRTDPERRYTSVADLVEDVERYLAGQPVRARPDTWGYRATKLVRRRPGAVAAGMALILAGGVYTATLRVHTERLASERDRAEAALDRARVETSKAEQVTTFLTRLFENADPANARGDQLTVREVLDRGLDDQDNLPVDREVRAELLSVMAGVYHSLGMYDASLSLAQEALALRRQAHGEHHRSVVSDLHSVGRALLSKGDNVGAAQAFRQAMATGRPLLGDADILLANTLESLSAALRVSGAAATIEAREAVQEALAIRSRIPSTDPLETAARLHTLGDLLAKEWDHLGALRADEEALTILRGVHGDNHPTVADALHRVAVHQRDAGDVEAAESTFREAITLKQRVLGPEHPGLVSSMNNLGMLLRERRNYEDSERIFREVLELQSRALGPEHPQTVWVRSNLARTLAARGEYDAAERLFGEALSLLHRTGGPDHPNTGHLLLYLAEVYAARGDLARAVEVHRDALARLRAAYGDDHPSLITGINLLGSVLRTKSQLVEAEALHRAAYSAAQKQRRGDSRHAAVSLVNVGLVQRDSGDLEGAASSLRRALEMQIRMWGERHPEVDDTREYLRDLLVLRGNGTATSGLR